MRITKKITILLLIVIACTLAVVESDAFITIEECLVISDIGKYSFKNQRTNLGEGTGVVGGAGHFNLDHTDVVCTGRHSNINELRGLPRAELTGRLVSVKVQVTQHSGSESDKWLLHEVDAEFRNYFGIPDLSYTVKNIDGNTVLIFQSGGRDYRWLSGTKVVHIEYTDLQMTKLEPLEVVKAYLVKHPSTLSQISVKELRSDAKVKAWVKDEMERRLWLCDKWFMQLQLGKAELSKVLKESVSHLELFLLYRDKYYQIDGEAEAKALRNYLNQNNGTMIKTKLQEYKDWWEENKENPINL